MKQLRWKKKRTVTLTTVCCDICHRHWRSANVLPLHLQTKAACFFRSSQVTDGSFAYSINCISALGCKSTSSGWNDASATVDELGVRLGVGPTLANEVKGVGSFTSGGELGFALNVCALGLFDCSNSVEIVS